LLPDEFLKKVRAIEIAARKLMKEGMTGAYMSAFRGSGMQFKEFRNYVYGDDVRHISWNVSARTQEPVLKTFEEERERTLFLIVDVSASLRRGPWARAKAEKLAEVAATLAVSAAEANDKLGLLLFSDKVEAVIPPAKGRTHLLRVIRDVLAFEPKGKKTNPDLALRQIDRVLKKQSIVFFLSDMEVLPSDQVLRRTTLVHEVVGVHVEHPQEWELPAGAGFIELQTAELGRPVTIDASSTNFRQYMRSHGISRSAQCEETFNRNGVDLLRIATNEDYVPVLRNYFAKRGKHFGARSKR
jgi:uncharacterized protein (DUF58 family)